MTLVIGLLLATFMLSMSSTSATSNWLTYRNDIVIGSGSTDISDVITLSAGVDGSGVLKLPCNIANLSTMTFNVTGTGSDAMYYNLTVNTKAVNASSTLGAAATNSTTKANYVTATGSTALTNITWAYNASITANATLTVWIITDDAVLSSYWLAENLVIKEKDVTSPFVANIKSSSASYWTVNNSCNTSNTWGINFTDVLLNITYPSNKVTNGTANFTITTFANGSTNEQYTQYQKTGPYVYSTEEEVTGSEHVVTVKLKSPEVLRDCVDWTLTTSSDVYDDYFDDIDYSSLVVKLNSKTQDWVQGSVLIEDTDVQTSPANNEWTFTWTVSAAPGAAAGIIDQIAETLEGTSFGLANWLWVLFAVVIIIALVLVVVYYKK